MSNNSPVYQTYVHRIRGLEIQIEASDFDHLKSTASPATKQNDLVQVRSETEKYKGTYICWGPTVDLVLPSTYDWFQIIYTGVLQHPSVRFP